LMQRSKVDLPDPDGPRMLIVSPEWIWSDTFLTTSTPSKLFEMSST